ncbi:MAG: hypothetical protein I3273_04915 [Candidatus Moeniiplasma glomeromycotorum]|nr:hypothetical protein [Candidatus Moeniiplasma glomeromycotorum]MCE8167883.1 hypothetical protein [Candidatus Moeniiplasma glomeromycotorum]MCE8169308.1 hypothetical protein [Candidatus Moeniiplasma glomeromycotorum]MCE8169433.1 hypothetical protein [Candidatus Moeniiplasma glomeromycotorum]
MDLHCALIVGGVAVILVGMGYGYKMSVDKKHIHLEKKDKMQEQRHNQNCQRIEKLEEKNGKELREIEELKIKIITLERVIENISKNKQKSSN